MVPREGLALGSLRFAQGLRDYPLASLDAARGRGYSEEERALIDAYRTRLVVGRVDTVRARLRELADATQADEIMIRTHIHEEDARRRSYTLIAEATNPA